MTAAAKLKVSLTLSADILTLVDRDARSRRSTRSGVVEQWLRRAATAKVAQDIESATAAYYASLREEERDEDTAMARALSLAARRVVHDGSPKRRRRRRST